MARRFDAIIVGAGQAGPPLAGRLTKAGMTVAMIERKLFGGTCVNTGCIPTKTLVASAHAAHLARRGGDFGVTVRGDVVVDMKAVKARKDAISGKSREGVETMLRTMEGCTVFHEAARFRSPTELQVGDEVLTAEKIFLNVGGRASIPDLPGLNDVHVADQYDHAGAGCVARAPGGGLAGSYIGLEFAQMYRRFGSKVTVGGAGQAPGGA